jgi:hypothetical protein
VNALDVTARGLAKRALDAETISDEGIASLSARSEPTAAALEALSAGHAALSGLAGASHTVETAPYLTRQRLVVRGNGAELRNVDPTPLSSTDVPQGALPVGVSNVWGTEWLTYYPVLSTSGTVLTVAAGEGDHFAVGDLVVVHGATSYFVSNGEYHVYRNYTRARVIAVTTSSITLDRVLPAELTADNPVIANTDAGASAAFEGPPRYYLLYAPHISNLTVASDVGETLKWGGVIDGTFRDLTMIGRNGVVLNAMQDCLIENVHFHSWRKICEMGEGSVGTTVRNLRGTLSDGSAKFGGASDVAPFFIGIGENSAGCVFEGFDVSSGPNNATAGIACQITAGHNNEIRNSRLRFPAQSGNGVAITSSATAANPNVDCGFRNVEVHLPAGNMFFGVVDYGAGVVRPYLVDCRFFGSVAVRAGTIQGDQGILRNVWCEDGGLEFVDSCTNWQITDCYFPNGFENLSPALMKANPGIRDNESDASRRLNAAAIIVQQPAMTITSTSLNAPWQSATFAAGDLAAYDRIHIYAEATAGGLGSTTRSCRVSLTSNGQTTGIGSSALTSSGPLCIEAELYITADTNLGSRVNIAGTITEGNVNIPSLAANDLTVTVEYWVGAAADPIFARTCRIIPVKPGMRHLPLR